MNGNTRVSPNFKVKEWLSKSALKMIAQNGFSPLWFINPILVNLAEFYKSFFYKYYKAKYPNLKDVLIIINTSGYQTRGARLDVDITSGSKYSFHKFLMGFDCEIKLLFNDGTKKEVDYKEIHRLIYENEDLFLKQGLTTIESIKITKGTGWLHSDIRYWGDNRIHTVAGPKYDKL